MLDPLSADGHAWNVSWRLNRSEQVEDISDGDTKPTDETPADVMARGDIVAAVVLSRLWP